MKIKGMVISYTEERDKTNSTKVYRTASIADFSDGPRLKNTIDYSLREGEKIEEGKLYEFSITDLFEQMGRIRMRGSFAQLNK